MERKLETQFEAYYAENYEKVLRYFIHKINNREEAEDLTQETFAYCYKNFETFDSEKSAFTTWLYLVANCRLKNFYRDRKVFADFDALEGILPDDCISDVDQAIYMESVRREIANALQQLPEKNRKLVIMKYFLQKNHSEIAAELGISEANSRVLLTRSIKKLSDLLKGLKEQEE